jgi:hypothetical protein
MSLKDALPKKVSDLLLITNFAEFATMTAKGVPIDTPLLNFPDEDLAHINMATGVSYPVKAERARRNPKVGLLYWPLYPGEPVVQVIGLAATRDRDIQQNTLRYLAETSHVSPETPWAVRRKAVWYWARIIIEIQPKEVLWWDSPEAMDQAPQRWSAPAGTVFATSDPAPESQNTAAPKWPQPDWRKAASVDAGASYPAYVSLVDDDGFPRIMRAGDVRVEDDGLSFDLPKSAPGRRSGPASLTYFGRDTFVGEVREDGGRVRLVVERTLPILPFVGEGNIWDPSPEVKEPVMKRLEAELARRGQPLPDIPVEQPQLSIGAQRRATRDTRGADEGMFERKADEG